MNVIWFPPVQHSLLLFFYHQLGQNIIVSYTEQSLSNSELLASDDITKHAGYRVLTNGIMIGMYALPKKSNTIMKPFTLIFLASAIMLFPAFTARSQGKIGIGDVFPGKVVYSGFSLDKAEKVKISGHGGAYHYDGSMIVYYGWIINADTRKVVWHTADNVDKPKFDYGDFDIDASVTLDKGTYEAYFTGAFHHRNGDWNMNAVGSLFNDVFGDRNKEKFKTEIKEGMGIEVSSASLTKVNSAGMMDQKVAGAVVSILKLHDNDNVKRYFSLNGTTSLRIYAIGEGNEDETFDYAWIYDVDTRKRVWVMDYSNADFAGGAEKNLVVKETITLPAGNYMVSYSTDDSHCYNDWNSLPPHDPQFSGITIWPAGDKDKSNVVAYRGVPAESKPVLELTGIGDDEYVSRGLKIGAAMDLRVLCIGEASDGVMADNGWIMNASTREVVWDMNEAKTEHAGGARKNRMADAVIRLEKGDYIVYYSTDDSHSYRDWNAAPPHEQRAYGITLWPAKEADRSKVSTFEPKEYKNDKVVVEIVRVRDHENLNESFTLDKDTNLRILALGEGDDGEMFDYGWIENTDTKKIVWEMTYRNTESAGGASKNRLYNDTVILPKGSYRVYYETDGSHSYRNWNASPPRDPERYGISLMKEIN
jgi:hypothetical protein